MKPKADTRETIPLVREELEIERKKVDTGGLRVRKTSTEKTERVRDFATQEELVVERVPMDRVVDAPTGIRQEGDVTVIPVFEETVTVRREWRLKEEVRIGKRRTQVPFEEEVVLRKESAVVERTPPLETK